MTFFAKLADCVKEVNIDSKHCKLMICMDNSGSTHGAVLEHQKTFAANISSYFANVSIVQWDDTAKRVKRLRDIQSRGGTSPACAIPLIVETMPDFLLFMTDGQVGNVDGFRAALLATNIECPTIVCLTVSNCFDASSNSTSLCGVNMSIVEAFMSASNDVAIVLNFCSEQKPLLLNATGIFSSFVNRSDSGVDPALATFGQMSLFDFGAAVHAEKDNTFAITLKRSSRSSLFVETLNTFVNLGEFQQFLQSFSGKDAVFNVESLEEQLQLAAVFEKLCERMVLPKIDPASFLNLLHGFSAAIEQSRLQKQVQEKKFLITKLQMQIALAKQPVATNSETFADEEPSAKKAETLSLAELETLLQTAKSELEQFLEKREAICITPALIKAVERLRSILTEYKQDKTKFSYEMGSARASAATEIDATLLKDVGKCARGECPILLTEANLAILLQLAQREKLVKIAASTSHDDDGDGDEKPAPEEPDFQQQLVKMVSACTNNTFIDNALLFGADFFDAITPGVVSVEFAQEYKGNHPLTNGHIIGFVPLAYDLTIFRKHLCMVLCGGREMFHVVPAYVAMIAKNMRQHSWTNSHVLAHARYILDNLLVRCRFIKTASAEKKKEKIAAAKQRISKHTKKVKQFVKTVSSQVGEDEGVTLREAIQYQLTNYQTCLAHVAYSEARSMVNIAIQLMPDFTFDVAKVLSFIGTINSLRIIRQAYVSSPVGISFECTNQRRTLVQRFIAAMCFEDYFKNRGALRGLKFQQFAIAALEVPRFGPILKRLCTGEQVAKEELQSLCLNQTASPGFIKFNSNEYKKAFAQHLTDVMTPGQKPKVSFVFENIDVVFSAVEIFKRCSKSGETVTFAMLQQKLQWRYGLENPALHAAIIQRQILLAVPLLDKLCKKRRSELHRAYLDECSKLHDTVCGEKRKQEMRKQIDKRYRFLFSNFAGLYNSKRQQRKDKKKQQKKMVKAKAIARPRTEK